MRLQRIYSSKAYVTSTRKDRIQAAMQDPINVELIQQLSDYLDEQGKEELEQATAETAPSSELENTTPTTTETPISEPSTSEPSHFSGDVFKDFGADEMESVSPISDNESTDVPAQEPNSEPEETAATTLTTGTPIVANTVWTTLDDVVSDCDTIQGTLNSRENTHGVNRLQVKDNELWVYFNDDINLNDQMIDVIELLNATGYTYLKFNRLARSNNAIVFDIDLVAGPMKSKEELNDEI